MATADGFGTQKVHRLNSLDADRTDLFGGPNVAVPPQHLMSPTTPHPSTTAEMTIQNTHETGSAGAELTKSLHHPPNVTSDDFALAFDIDGVFVKGGKPIPEAIQAMKYINGDNPYGVKVYVLSFSFL